MQLPSHIKKRLSGIVFILLSFSFLSAQPPASGGQELRENLFAIRTTGLGLIRKQRINEAIPVLLSGVKLAQQASLDSFTGAFYTLLATSYRYRAGFDSSLYYLELANKIATAGKYTTLRAAILIEYYGVYNRLGKGDSTAAAAGRLKEILPVLDSTSSESAKIEMYLGHDEKHKANYTESSAHYYKALHKFMALKDSVNEGSIYTSLANVFVLTGQLDRALDYHQLAAALFTRIGRRNELVAELLNITDMYYTSGRLDSAEITARQALAYAQDLKEKSYETYAYLHLGNIYKLRKEYAKAEDYFLRSIKTGETLESNNTLIELYQGLGEMYMDEQQPAKAKPYFEKQLALAREARDKGELIEASQNLAANEYALHDYAKAYEYQKLYSSYKDSAYTESTSKSMAEMESKYQAERKEKEISLLKKDQQLSKLTLQKQANFQIGAIIFLVLLVLIGFLVINRYRVLQRAKRLIEMEKMRNTIARDLHDDIGSTLTSINIISKVALQQQAEVNGPMDTSMQKIKERSSAIMENMGDIVWAINPQNDTVEQMISRMKEFAAEILEPLNISYSFKETGDFAFVKLDIRKRRDLYLFFKEAVNNAAKYSQGHNLSIELVLSQNTLHLTIRDDGIGFNEEEARHGNGLRNMRGRAASMQAAVRIETAPGKGTLIDLDMPLT